MSTKKQKRKTACPGCHVPKLEHDFGPLHKNCEGPFESGSESDTNSPKAAKKESSSHVTETTKELLHAVRALSEQVGAIQLGNKSLREIVEGKGGGSAKAKSQEPSSAGNISGNIYVDLATLLTPHVKSDDTIESRADYNRKLATIESFDHWLEAWSIYEEKLIAIDTKRYKELARYRSIIQKANRKFRWNAVYEYDVQFRRSLFDIPTGRLDVVDTTLYATILDSSAVRKEGITCQRCKSDKHLVRDCSFRAKTSLEENKGSKKPGTGASTDQGWKFEKWFNNDTEGCNLFQRRACQQGKECKRAHVCKTCRGNHAMADCKQGTNNA
ncbi:hypothetical protein QZH41_003447 [Actinostola sp. cb2023]|nr:hypothetical protein QZH41_003447 [Actinostola sp. cb2023]